MIIISNETEEPLIIHNLENLDKIIASASENARRENILGMIFLRAENGNELGIVVGGEDTVLSFESGSKDPPYFASKGKSVDAEPTLICYAYFTHHTEFSRKYVIPAKAGLMAVYEFYQSNELPSCIEWEEV